jgi:hypothetical protein
MPGVASEQAKAAPGTEDSLQLVYILHFYLPA